MKFTLAVLALMFGNTIASPHDKHTHMVEKGHAHLRAEAGHIRFATTQQSCNNPVEKTWLPPAKKQFYRRKCNVFSDDENADEHWTPSDGSPRGGMEIPANAQACVHSDPWTIIHAGYCVACQFDKEQKKCRGMGDPAVACKRQFQKVEESIVLAELQ